MVERLVSRVWFVWQVLQFWTCSKGTIFLLGGCNIEGEDESWDFGTGAGFYVDATEDPWKTNYRMYSYIKDEVTLLLGSPAVVG